MVIGTIPMEAESFLMQAIVIEHFRQIEVHIFSTFQLADNFMAQFASFVDGVKRTIPDLL